MRGGAESCCLPSPRRWLAAASPGGTGRRPTTSTATSRPSWPRSPRRPRAAPPKNGRNCSCCCNCRLRAPQPRYARRKPIARPRSRGSRRHWAAMRAPSPRCATSRASPRMSKTTSAPTCARPSTASGACGRARSTPRSIRASATSRPTCRTRAATPPMDTRWAIYSRTWCPNAAARCWPAPPNSPASAWCAACIFRATSAPGSSAPTGSCRASGGTRRS